MRPVAEAGVAGGVADYAAFDGVTDGLVDGFDIVKQRAVVVLGKVGPVVAVTVVEDDLFCGGERFAVS